MTKKINDQAGWDKQRMNQAVEEFIKWYVQELKSPSGEVKQVPFLIDIKYTKDGNESVTILGEENIQKYLQEKKGQESVS